MSKTNSEWVKVGTLMKNKDTSKDNYIKVDANVTLEKDSYLQVQDPRKKIDAAVKAGRLSAEIGAEMKSKIPEFVLRDIVLAPRR